MKSSTVQLVVLIVSTILQVCQCLAGGYIQILLMMRLSMRQYSIKQRTKTDDGRECKTLTWHDIYDDVFYSSKNNREVNCFSVITGFGGDDDLSIIRLPRSLNSRKQ